MIFRDISNLDSTKIMQDFIKDVTQIRFINFSFISKYLYMIKIIIFTTVLY